MAAHPGHRCDGFLSMGREYASVDPDRPFFTQLPYATSSWTLHQWGGGSGFLFWHEANIFAVRKKARKNPYIFVVKSQTKTDIRKEYNLFLLFASQGPPQANIFGGMDEFLCIYYYYYY